MPEKTPSPRRAAYLRTVRREKRRVRIWQIALVVGLFAVWELSCRLGLSDGFLVSSPSRMVQTLWRLCASGELWHHAAVSIGETVLGRGSMLRGALSVFVGSILYRIIYAAALSSRIIEAMKLLTAILVALAIAAPTLKQWAAFQKRKAEMRKGGR